MYTIILFTVLGLAGGLIRARYDGTEKISNYTRYSFNGMCAGCSIGMLTAIVLVRLLVPMQNVVSEPITLAAMRNQDGISASFIFGSGSINSVNTYNFLQRTKDGSMVPGSVPANGLVHLIEDPELKNTGSWSTTISKPDKSSPLYPWSFGAEGRAHTVRQEFRVPVGTFVQQFTIK